MGINRGGDIQQHLIPIPVPRDAPQVDWPVEDLHLYPDLGELRLHDGSDDGQRGFRAICHEGVAQGVLRIVPHLLEQGEGLLGVIGELLPKVEMPLAPWRHKAPQRLLLAQDRGLDDGAAIDAVPQHHLPHPDIFELDLQVFSG